MDNPHFVDFQQRTVAFSYDNDLVLGLATRCYSGCQWGQYRKMWVVSCKNHTENQVVCRVNNIGLELGHSRSNPPVTA